MSAFPPALGRFAVSILSLVLMVAMLPVSAIAQEEAPTPVGDSFEVTGVAAEADAVFAWTVSEPDQHWHLAATAPAGERARLQLYDAEGNPLGRVEGDEQAAFYDLALDAGTYEVRVPKAGESYEFRLTSSPEQVRYDPEPNDEAGEAMSLADGDSVTGRLARNGDKDRYELEVGTDDSTLRDIEFVPTGEATHRLCLLDAEGRDRQCRNAAGSLALTDLLLEPGVHQLLVTGSTDPTASYELRVVAGEPRPADYAAEPNDWWYATSWMDEATTVRGRTGASDPEFLDIRIDGETQLWRAEATGAIDQLAWVRGDRTVAESRPYCSGAPAVIEDLYLAPGTHRFYLDGCSDDELAKDDYTLTLMPIGLPDPDAEREPNNDEVRAEPYRIGERKVGRLTSDEDTDIYRFTLAAPTGLHLRLTQPAEAETAVRLSSGQEIWRVEAMGEGGLLEADLWLEAGDYLLMLDPRTAAEGSYELVTTWLDPLEVPADAEPNDRFGFAREVPATLTWSGGRSGDGRDTDGYWLPPLEMPGAATIHVEGEGARLHLYSDPRENVRVELEEAEDGSFVAQDAPVGVPLYLEMWADDEYTVRLDAPGWSPATSPAELPLTARLALESETVAAYRTEGQVVSGTYTLENEGTVDLDLALDVVSDHYAFEPVLEASRVSVPAGGSVEVPLLLSVRPDAWARWPVHLTAVARADDGAAAASTAIVDGVAGAEPVGLRQAWAVPDELLGGLNVAGAALGGVPAGTVDDEEPLLFDDVTPGNSGFGGSTGALPIELVVDLAGDSPVPVVGTVLNPLARGSRLNESVRDFELLLSTDGSAWEPALSGKLERLPIDQYFTLETPTMATHAMLRIHAMHGDGRSDFAALGEWKVIAEPGAVPDDMPTDIADPIRGGHLVRSLPHRGGPDNIGPLDDELDRDTASFDDDGTFELVIGFQEGRAAQITELRWTDPEGTKPEEQVPALEVEVSADGPLGPWESLGWWDLVRAEDGSVEPFVLEEPAWARYIRLALTVDPEEVRRLEHPGHLDVIERATDDEYRSILGEWGYTSPVGPFEWSIGSATEDVPLGSDAGDTLEDATDIAEDVPRSDRATIIDDPDWYRIEVPEGDNTLSILIEGTPSVGVDVSLYDADGAPRELPRVGRAQSRERYEAVVEPGTYYLEVIQPPFNVAFTFDTSGSMGPYLDFVFEGMRAFTSGIQPGREMALIVPFEELPLLEEWSDQPQTLEDAVNNYVPVKQSSAMLIGLKDSTERVSAREGTRAVLVVGDAETGTGINDELWDSLEDVQPVVYTVHVGSDSNPDVTRNMTQSYAAANGGVYDYPTTHAAMERAFERMSTRLRQPSLYTLTASSSFVDRRPASLQVISPPGQTLGLAGGTAVALILDTSGSMNKRLDGKKRIVIAKNSMKKLVNSGLAEGLPVSLRVFGGTGKKTGCETRQIVPLGPLDREATIEIINKLKIDKKTGTPIAAALREVKNDLADVTGERVVVLITDGKATCKEDPEEALAELDEAGFEVNLNIVGFALDDDAVKEQMRGWAEANAGTYYDAADAQALVDAVTVAVAAPVDVYAVSDRSTRVASTTVGGDAVVLEPGEYVLEVRSDPPLEIEGVVLAGGQSLTYELEVPQSLTTDEEDAP